MALTVQRAVQHEKARLEVRPRSGRQVGGPGNHWAMHCQRLWQQKLKTVVTAAARAIASDFEQPQKWTSML